MSTSNFYKANARHYYAVGMNRYFTKEDVEENEMDESMIDQFDEVGTQCDYEFAIENLVESLKEKGYSEDDEWESGNSGYELHSLAYKHVWLKNGNFEVCIKMKVGVRAGYYEGGNLDWSCEIEDGYRGFSVEVGADDTFDMQRVREDLVSDYETNPEYGKNTRDCERLAKKINKTLAAMIEEVEQTMEDCCQYKLEVRARFSNGETWYKEVGKAE